MNTEGIFNRNLLALSARHPELVSRISRINSSPRVGFIASRSQSLVPTIFRDGRSFPMHSRFDPVSEGIRLAENAPSGYLIAFGLGGAFHLKPLLKGSGLTGLIIIEKDFGIFRSILEHIDLTNLFSDSRVTILLDYSPQELMMTILDHYLPVFHGNLGSISLRPRWDSELQWFTERAEALKGLPESLGRDYTVQTRFGRRWFVNTLGNLARSEQIHCVFSTSKRLLITAAGPSLREQLPRIRQLKSDGATILATDTSLPVLLAGDIAPDMVLSIDCQVISYHHFFKKLPKSTILILDLASPPVLARLTNKVLFFCSGHPFSLYLNRHYRRFPLLNVSGGSVTHAATSFAQIAGAHDVHLFGGDFSYPMGQPYSQGAYIYPYFHSKSKRTEGSELAFWEFIHRSKPRREQTQWGWRWRTMMMDLYREDLEKATAKAGYHFIPEMGSGVPIQAANFNGQQSMPVILCAGKKRLLWQELLKDYQERLKSLPLPTGMPQDYFVNLDIESREAWATLLPAAATFRINSTNGPNAVEKARMWTLQRIESIQKRFSHF